MYVWCAMSAAATVRRLPPLEADEFSWGFCAFLWDAGCLDR